MANYAYALVDETTGDCLLVDPAWNPLELVALLRAEERRVVGVVLTHFHADHAGGRLFDALPIAGVAELLAELDVPVHVQGDEVAWVTRGTGLDKGAFVAHQAGDTLSCGAGEVVLVHTPGHTPGSQCLLTGGDLLTGDTLFLDGCGRTDLPGGDPGALHESLTRRLQSVPETVRVYAGHAYSRQPFATMGVVRATNPVLAPLDEEEWLARFS